MSRTYRRKDQRHEYSWVLRDWTLEPGYVRPVSLDRHSPEGRRAIAKFHSDACVTMKGFAPRWFRRLFKRRQRNLNNRQFQRWLADPAYEPLMDARHRHSAHWAWW